MILFKDYKKSFFHNQISYVYWITDKRDGKHYIGSRGSKKSDLMKDLLEYGTTSCRKDDILNNPNMFVFNILRIFENRLLAYQYEILLHNKFEVELNDKFFNKSRQTTLKFTMANFSHVYNKETDEFEIINISDFDETKHSKMGTFYNNNLKKFVKIASCHRDSKIHKTLQFENKLYVRTKESDKFFQICRDEYNPKIHIRNTTNKVVVKNINDSDTENILVSKEEFENNPNLVSIHKGSLTVFDKKDKKYKRISKENYNTNDYSISSSNIVYCMNLETNEKVAVSKEEYYSNKHKYELYITTIKVYDKKEKIIKFVKKSYVLDNLDNYILNPTKKILVNYKENPLKNNFYVNNLEYESNIDLYDKIYKKCVIVIEKETGKTKAITSKEFQENKDKYIKKGKNERL